MTVLDLLGARVTRDARGRDVLTVVAEDARRVRESARNEALHPLTWRLQEECPWPKLPDLSGYRPTEDWHLKAATKKQRLSLRSYGVDVGRKLTRGEANYLIARLMLLERDNPVPATSAQEWRLRREGYWQPDMPKRKARQLIAALERGK